MIVVEVVVVVVPIAEVVSKENTQSANDLGKKSQLQVQLL